MNTYWSTGFGSEVLLPPALETSSCVHHFQTEMLADVEEHLNTSRSI